MAFILDAERRGDCNEAFAAYREYLASVESKFPPHAYALATHDWYFGGAQGDQGPHDSRVLNCEITEVGSFDQDEPPSIKIRLREAYDDGIIELVYPQVFKFALTYQGKLGHQNWRYDEFRLADSGHVIHEIEWCGARETGNWLIEASDVIYTWHPK